MPASPEALRAARNRDRWRLGLAACAVLLTAADTYVVVVALPSIMTGVGVGLDRLQRATPIISGFLLGYTAVLPLIGRLADLAGTEPVFAGCLGAFGIGSVVTATAHALPVVVAGRALQGIGGGGLVPVTQAMVAARWPPDARGLPLGLVGALQELGSVAGPLYGAAIVAVASWRAIFWINVPVTVVLGAGFWLTRASPAPAAAPSAAGPRASPGLAAAPSAAGPRGWPGLARSAGRRGRLASPAPAPVPTRSQGRRGRLASPAPAPLPAPAPAPALASRPRPDLIGLVLVVAAATGLLVGLDSPAGLANSATVGRLWTPVVTGVWAPFTTPIVLAAGGVVVVFLCWERFAPSSVRRLVRLDQARAVLTRADLPGAAVLAAILGCVVVLFSTADPSKQVVASSAPLVGPVAVALIGVFYWRQRHASAPLIEPGALAARPAWGALAVNLALGAALMAALVDVPLFARATVDPNSEVAAALVLVRFLVPVPIGAVIGGALCRSRSRAPVVAATGMAMAAVSFVAMASWSATALGGGPGWSDVALVICGLGFGLAIAPVNVAILGAVPPNVHALASALAVAARTIGMLAGLSALTAIGIHRFYAAQARIGSPLVLCPANPGSCPAYDTATTQALLSELHTIFGGAAVCAAAAGVLALLLLRSSADVQDVAAVSVVPRALG